ncbi:MAG TPA: hypothetical protein DIW17_01385 [Clostridiales bacterium]|nr:hypothetical protein [Clostridia bacterium]MDD4679536.1 hypothetical protein [Clostridia bacterium]HCS72515.1 hypothetical protein [Clostridiales bacterium]
MISAKPSKNNHTQGGVIINNKRVPKPINKIDNGFGFLPGLWGLCGELHILCAFLRFQKKMYIRNLAFQATSSRLCLYNIIFRRQEKVNYF